MRLTPRGLSFALLVLVPAAAAAACGSSSKAPQNSFTTASNGSSTSVGASTGSGGAPVSTSTSTGNGGAGGGVHFTGAGGGSQFSDFPATPIVDPSAPPNAPALFAGSTGDGGTSDGGSGGPCLFEPEPDTLFPNNWLRPRFNWTPGSGQNLFELRLHASVEVNDLVVYTADAPWEMPANMWAELAENAQGAPITITITGATYNGTALTGAPSVGSVQTMTIAPAPAAGSIVYWSTSNGSILNGFSAGDESVVPVLTPPQVQMQSAGGAVTCIGCHTSTPDGNYAGFTAEGPWGNALASIEASSVGAAPSFLGAGAQATLEALSPLGIQTYSKAHWASGDHVMIAPYGDSAMFGGTGSQLLWIDLEAATNAMGTSYGPILRTGDTNDVGAPTFSHDGNTIAYVSTNVELTGRLDNGIGLLYSVPYNNRAGGAATPITGAADMSYEQYYPAFSPDDAYLAFDRIPAGNTMYNQPVAEVFVLPAAGGTPTRLAANDPAACTGKTSPGVTNSWPKWAPQVTTVGTKSYYWVIFSSTRDPMGNPQLYITGVVIDGGAVETHGALYVWNQPAAENNHTPAWDYFMIPTQ